MALPPTQVRSTIAFLSLAFTAAAWAAPDFDRDVRPIFSEHCLQCHSLDKAKGGLALVSREEAMKKTKSGHPVLVPGQPDGSGLFARVTSSDPDEQMPPPKDDGKKPLSQKEIDTLKQWIAAGADWPLHWAYRPIVKPPVPVLPAAGSPSARVIPNPIDAFVLRKLRENRIAPSPEADRYTLIRRVWYDLLGLPPAPEEVDAFVNDRSPLAYEQIVDAALASEHFGERWGRHWLDMARYADSDGYEKDRPRPDAWRYRDWVIQATNKDIPFDQFTIEQIGGDLLPNPTQDQVLATAFHRQTLTNTEGGTDQEQFRVEAVFDRVETTGAVWLGLTVGCARCHTHKYDQITQKEYYEMFAFYNNGDEVNRRVPVSELAWNEYERSHGQVARELASLQRKVDEAKANVPNKLPEWEKDIQARLTEARNNLKKQQFTPLEVREVSSKDKTRFRKLPDGSFLALGKKPPPTDTYTLEIDSWSKPLTALRLEALPDDSLPGKGPGRMKNGNFVLSRVKVIQGESPERGMSIPLHSAKADYVQAGFSAEDALDGGGKGGWAVGGQPGKPHTLTLQLSRPIAPEQGRKLFVVLEQNYATRPTHLLGRFRLLGSSDVTEGSIAPPEVVKVLNEEPLRRNAVVIKPLIDWLEKVDSDVIAATSALEQAEQQAPKPPLMDVRVIAQRSASPRVTKVLHRGDFLSPTEVVQPDTLNVLPKMEHATAAAPNRLDLARWLVSPRNPLTPRVTVNHIWAHLFGEGIVRTPYDFGVRGDRPTHPELLDWLAATFVEQGWSRKRLIKTILMSATYKQSSAERPELADIDPQNKLLHRQNRLRVEGEIVRDLYLTASGLLSQKIGGPSVFPPMPPDIAELSYANNFKWIESTGEDRYRRGMYTFFKRTAPHPDLTTFDCPDANTTNVKRTVSNTPLQALTTLNAEAFAESAKALAKRVLTEKYADDDERITRAFRLCVSRPPGQPEIQALRRLLYDSRAWYARHLDEARTLTKGISVKTISADEMAAWTATARIVLNLDEFITRE